MRLAYFHANCLLTVPYKKETETRWRKDDDKIKKQTVIDRHGPRYSSNDSQPTNPLEFSFYTTVIIKYLIILGIPAS